MVTKECKQAHDSVTFDVNSRHVIEPLNAQSNTRGTYSVAMSASNDGGTACGTPICFQDSERVHIEPEVKGGRMANAGSLLLLCTMRWALNPLAYRKDFDERAHDSVGVGKKKRVRSTCESCTNRDDVTIKTKAIETRRTEKAYTSIHRAVHTRNLTYIHVPPNTGWVTLRSRFCPGTLNGFGARRHRDAEEILLPFNIFITYFAMSLYVSLP